METREPYEVLIELHSGGTLHLALSDQDKILVVRAFVLSLPLQNQIVQDFLLLLNDYEQKSKPIDFWKIKLDGAKADLVQSVVQARGMDSRVNTRFVRNTTIGVHTSN